MANIFNGDIGFDTINVCTLCAFSYALRSNSFSLYSSIIYVNVPHPQSQNYSDSKSNKNDLMKLFRSECGVRSEECLCVFAFLSMLVVVCLFGINASRSQREYYVKKMPNNIIFVIRKHIYYLLINYWRRPVQGCQIFWEKLPERILGDTVNQT